MPDREELKVASKSQDVRPKITLACEECKERNYITKKNRRNTPDRLELKVQQVDDASRDSLSL